MQTFVRHNSTKFDKDFYITPKAAPLPEGVDEGAEGVVQYCQTLCKGADLWIRELKN